MYSLPYNISRRWPTPPPRYRFGRARVGLAEARFSQHKSFFRNFWSHGPQNRCIWSKISRGNWFWHLKLSSCAKNRGKITKTDFWEQKKNNFFGFWKSIFRHFSWILEGIDNFRRQNQFPREILFQIHLFWSPCDQKLRKNYYYCGFFAGSALSGRQT